MSRGSAGGLGVAVLGSIIAAAFTADLARLAGVPGAAMDQARESLPEALKVAGELGDPASAQLSQLARESFMHGFHLAIAVSVVVMLVTAALTARVLRGDPDADTTGDSSNPVTVPITR